MTLANTALTAVGFALRAAIRAYQWILAPVLGSNCRFVPSCSEYAREAIEQHGAARGAYLATLRLARCHPYGQGGVDPVPERFAWRRRCCAAAPEQQRTESTLEA